MWTWSRCSGGATPGWQQPGRRVCVCLLWRQGGPGTRRPPAPTAERESLFLAAPTCAGHSQDALRVLVNKAKGRREQIGRDDRQRRSDACYHHCGGRSLTPDAAALQQGKGPIRRTWTSPQNYYYYCNNGTTPRFRGGFQQRPLQDQVQANNAAADVDKAKTNCRTRYRPTKRGRRGQRPRPTSSALVSRLLSRPRSGG